MKNNIIDTYTYLEKIPKVHVKIKDDLFLEIKKRIKEKYSSLNKYSHKINVKKETLKWEFGKNTFHPFQRLIKIAKDAKISKKEVFDNITGFYCWGSHRTNTKIPRRLKIDGLFAEGYALYLAEGDNGSNGLKKPRKFRFTNSDASVINFMISWLEKYFPDIDKYIVVIHPLDDIIKYERTPILCNNVKHTKDKYNKKTKYKLCADNAILIDLFLELEQEIKKTCSKNKNLAAAYIRGMMIGEGTIYDNKMKYVRIEMRNEKEIKYLHKLLILLKYDCKTSLRTTRENMWSIYIGAKQLEKFNKEIGFGVHKQRQKKLEEAIIKTNETLKLANSLAKKSKLTEKDALILGKKINKAATRKFLKECNIKIEK